MKGSRLEKIKTKRATRQAGVYIILSIVIVVVMVIWGIPEAARLSGLLIRQDNGPALIDDIKPTPPIFSDIPESTSEDTVEINGFAQPGVEVSLYLNGELSKRILSDEAGTFSFRGIELVEGDNRVYAYAITSRGTESEQSKEYVITWDNTPPELTLETPSEGQVFHGERERIATFKGSVNEEGAKVYIGERMAIVQADGSFSLAYQLAEGDQEVMVKAIDRAGNELEQIIRLRYEP